MPWKGCGTLSGGEGKGAGRDRKVCEVGSPDTCVSHTILYAEISISESLALTRQHPCKCHCWSFIIGAGNSWYFSCLPPFPGAWCCCQGRGIAMLGVRMSSPFPTGLEVPQDSSRARGGSEEGQRHAILQDGGKKAEATGA